MCKLSFALILGLFSVWAYPQENIIIGDFSNNGLLNWEAQTFEGKTRYELVSDGTEIVVEAESSSSASGLIHRQRIDLYKTPFLNWRWKVDHSLYRLFETVKEGDDFAARIYIIKDGGLFFWNTFGLNYVWASSQVKGSSWENPYTGNVKMIAIESGDSKKQKWLSEKRNVRKDLKSQFNRDIRFIDAVAIMTDTDNSKQHVRAFYGDIYFSSQ